MDIWWLHALVFIFGYITCKTFYFLNATRVSLKLLKSSRVAYLLMAAKIVEQYAVSEYSMKRYLKESQQDEEVIKAFKIKFEQDLEDFKNSTIQDIIHNTPPTFRENLEFDDWRSAMRFLRHNKEDAFNFWRMGG
jgi:LPS O-antigen subunit length determinant protein (WzzB/FepE family)|tara:strand:- start:669 stop:1073 length:405 start_codon:yes stop_codon:yes gene_type:complete